MGTELLKHSMFYEVLFPKEIEDSKATFSLRRQITNRIPQTFVVKNASLVVFDFETTGLDFDTDRIIEVGALKIRNFAIEDEISSLIATDFELTPVIQQITGISEDMLKGKPTIRDMIPKLLKFMEGSILVAHNADFDVRFLKNEAMRCGFDIEWPALCTLKLARHLLPELERKTLDHLAAHYGLSFEARHRSIGDAKVTVAVLKEMLLNEGAYLKTWLDFEPFRSHF